MPVPSAQAYLTARVRLLDAAQAHAAGFLSDEELLEAEQEADRAGAGWDAHCKHCDDNPGTWKGK